MVIFYLPSPTFCHYFLNMLSLEAWAKNAEGTKTINLTKEEYNLFVWAEMLRIARLLFIFRIMRKFRPKNISSSKSLREKLR